MASSKSLFLLHAVLFALVFIISSDVAADQVSTKSSGIQVEQYGGGGGGGGSGGGCGGGGGYYCRYGCCRRYRYRPGCFKCCWSAQEAPDAEFEDDVKH